MERWTGLPGAGRFSAALERAVDTARSGRAVWWIVDGRRQGERVERALLEACPDGIAGVEIVTVNRLAQWLLEDAGTPLNPVSPTLRELIFRSLIGEREFAARWTPPDSAGWVRKASQLFERTHASGPDSLNRDQLRARFPWMPALYQAYDRWLQTAQRQDEAALAGLALRLLEDDPATLPGLLIVDRLAPLSHRLEHLLGAFAGTVDAAIRLVDQTDGVFALASPDPDREALWPQATATRPFSSPAAASAFARELFTVSATPDDDPNPSRVPPPHNSALWFHPDPAAEAQMVLRDAAYWVHETPVDESDIAIVCADLNGTLPRLRELADSYGLRLDASRSWPLIARPLAVLVLDLLSLRTAGLQRNRLTSLLLNPLVKYKKQLSSRENVLLLDTAAKEAGVRGGHGTFEREWAGPLKRVIELKRRPRRVPDDPEDEARVRAAAEQEANTLAASLIELRDLINLIHSIPDNCSAGELQQWLDSLFAELDIDSRLHTILRSGGDLDERLTLGRINVLFANLAQMAPGEHRRPLARWVELIRQGMQRMTVSEPQRIRAGIPVLVPGDLRGLRVKVLYLLGLTDERWPAKPDVDLIDPFSSAQGVQSLADARALTLEAFLAAEYVRISCPCPLEEEHNQSPSPLLQELVRADGNLVEPLNHQAEPEEFRGLVDLLPALGRDLSVPDDTRIGIAKRRLAAAASQVEERPLRAAWHGIRVESMRQNPETLTRYEGLLAGSPVGEKLAAAIADENVSPTRLDTYAQCPMKFFHKYVLKVQELRELEDEIDALTLGSLVHDILARTVQELRRIRGTIQVDLGENPDETARVMHEIGTALIEEQRLPSVYWDLLRDDLLGGLVDDNPIGRLKQALEDEKPDARGASKVKGERVTHIEAGFGLEREEGHDVLLEAPLRLEQDGETVEFRGRIDRIGLHPDKGWRVWDYKTSAKAPATDKEMRLGLKFQLPVYLWTLQKALTDGAIADVAEVDQAGYYLLRRFKEDEKQVSFSGLVPVKKFAEFSDDLLARVFELRRSIEAGRFHHPLSQNKELCPDDKYNNCPFKNTCRRDHFLFRQRATRLDRDALKAAYLFDFQPDLVAKQEGDA
ncbi:PD-(D/E)XK nuclease family protein [bacterium]|nr:PD-(D/E)XK nuclease family protein [bacterium]